MRQIFLWTITRGWFLLVRDGAVNVSEVTVFCLTFGLGGQNSLELASWSFMNFLFFLLLFCVSHWIGVRHVVCWGESCLLVVVVVVVTLVDNFFFIIIIFFLWIYRPKIKHCMIMIPIEMGLIIWYISLSKQQIYWYLNLLMKSNHLHHKISQKKKKIIWLLFFNALRIRKIWF